MFRDIFDAVTEKSQYVTETEEAHMDTKGITETIGSPPSEEKKRERWSPKISNGGGPDGDVSAAVRALWGMIEARQLIRRIPVLRRAQAKAHKLVRSVDVRSISMFDRQNAKKHR